MSDILVSVIMLSFNHDKFLDQAIEGVINQKTNFTWELIIADDCSTDSTEYICGKYSKTDDRIKYIRQSSNQGANKNFNNAYQNAHGKYIAFCESDDFWTEPLKLQKQIDFLEKNSDFAICFHDVRILRNNMIQNSTIKYNKDVFDIYDLAQENFMHTPSVVSRKLKITELPEYFNSLHVGDYIMHLYAARNGKIKFFPTKMAVYRIHEGGTWSNQNDIFIYERIAQYLEKLIHDHYFNKRVRSILKVRLKGSYQNLLSKKRDKIYLLKIASIDLVLAGKLILKSIL